MGGANRPADVRVVLEQRVVFCLLSAATPKASLTGLPLHETGVSGKRESVDYWLLPNKATLPNSCFLKFTGEDIL